MRVLHVGKFYHPVHGGIETVIRGIAEGLVAAGHEVEVLCFAADHRGSRESIDGVSVVRSPCLGRILSQPIAPRFRRLLLESGRGADIVHVHMPNPLAELAALRLPRDKPTVCTYHADVTRQKLVLPVYRPVVRRFLDRCDAIIAATPQHIENSPLLQPRRSRCRVIPFGLDPGRFEPTPPAARRIGQLEEQFGEFVLFVGRLVSYKGLTHLIEAARGLRHQVVIVGSGPLEADLRDQIVRSGLRDRVHLVGEVASDDELLAYFHACRVFALPSITAAEAFGVVLVEAMACGKPLVTSRLASGVAHVNQHDTNGLQVEAADPVELGAALRRVLEDHHLAERLGRAGRTRFETEFTAATMIRRHLEVYESLTVQTVS